MTIYIRNDKNKTILDCDYYIKTEGDSKFLEIKSSVIIETYSEFLLNSNSEKQMEIVEDFTELSELRGWLWESYFLGGDNNPEEYDNVLKILRRKISTIAKKYSLIYVED